MKAKENLSHIVLKRSAYCHLYVLFSFPWFYSITFNVFFCFFILLYSFFIFYNLYFNFPLELWFSLFLFSVCVSSCSFLYYLQFSFSSLLSVFYSFSVLLRNCFWGWFLLMQKLFVAHIKLFIIQMCPTHLLSRYKFGFSAHKRFVFLIIS